MRSFIALILINFFCLVHCEQSWNGTNFNPDAPSQFYGVDVSESVSESDFRCLLNANLEFAIVRAFRSTGSVDPNAPATVRTFSLLKCLTYSIK